MLTKKRSRRYPAKTITDADYADDIALLTNTPNQAETLLHSLERAAAGIGLHVNAHKTEFMCFNQKGDISTLDGTSLRLVDKFTYLGSSVSSTENDIDTRLTKAWTAIDRLSIIWKSNLTDKMKRSFFQDVVVSILLYGYTTWALTKRLEKIDSNYTRMLRAILNRSWQQHSTRRQLYGHLPPITKTIQAGRTRHAGHCWRTKDEIVSGVLLWTPGYGQSKAGRPARTFIQQLCDDTGCNPEDLPKAMNDRETWTERCQGYPCQPHVMMMMNREIFFALGLEIKTDHPIADRRQDLVLINKKKRICYLVDFDGLTGHGVKIKKGEKIDIYLDLAKERKKNYGTLKRMQYQKLFE